MNLKRYRVNNIQEALSQIKKDLGPDAIIVSTRQVKEGGGAFGLFGKAMLEVTAARDEKAAQKKTVKAAPATSVPGSGFGAGAYAQTASSRTEASSPFGGIGSGSAGSSGTGTHHATAPTAHPVASPVARQASLQRPQEDTQKIILPLRQEIQELKEMITGINKQPAQEKFSVGQLRSEVTEMRTILTSLAAQSGTLRNEDLDENLVVLFQQMVFAGLEEKFARRLVQEASKSILPEELQNFAYVKIFVARMLMKILKTTNGIRMEGQKQRVIALVGPTGVGKTTTTAKIASEQVLKYKRKVALITIDTFRIGAVEQLRAYAKIMNIPIRVVSNRAELDQAIAKFSDADVILVDTGGRSQRDEAQMFELKELFGERGRIENYLVLSATTKDGDLNEITRRFGDIPLDGVIFTKLDESTSYGCVFNHCIRFKKPVAFLTTGQKVPEDIEPATKERLVDLLLNISGN